MAQVVCSEKLNVRFKAKESSRMFTYRDKTKYDIIITSI